MINVIFSIFDPEWDGGDPDDRWERWRPSVSLLSHKDLVVDRLELIVQTPFKEAAQVAIDDMKVLSPHTDISIHEVKFIDPWDFEEVYAVIHDISDNYSFKTDLNNYYIHMSTGTHVSRICLFLLCEARIIPGMMIQSYPEHTYDEQIKSGWRTIDLSLTKYDRLAKRFKKRKTQGQWFLKSGIATVNSSFNETIEEMEQVAIRSHHPMLISGQTGTGKSVLARRVFELKKSRHQISCDFIPVNCATLRGDGAMSALFGHSKGAFTGANNNRLGLLKSAHNGLLFLDEIGELGLEEQAMLLTALEKGCFYPLGSDKEENSQFQLIAGTNKNLNEQVNLGLFRDDLLSRINLWHFELPNLKDRMEDLEPNIDFELAKFSSTFGKVISFNQDAYNHYINFSKSQSAVWRGNFRDLNASITRMATFADNGRITLDITKSEIIRLNNLWSSTLPPKSKSLLNTLLPKHNIENMDLFDRMQLEQVIGICKQHNSASKAGRALFEHSRIQRKSVNDADRLRKYLAKYNLDWQSIADTLNK